MNWRSSTDSTTRSEGRAIAPVSSPLISISAAPLTSKTPTVVRQMRSGTVVASPSSAIRATSRACRSPTKVVLPSA